MPPKKDKSIQIKVCILNKKNSSMNFSIRLKEGVTKEEAIKESVKFLKSKL